MEKTASLRPVLLDRDAHPAPTCPDSRRARAGEPARLRVLRSHFCMGSFCLEARDGPPPGVGTADLGDTEQGGGVKAESGKAEVGCVPGSGGAPTQAKLQWRDVHRAASRHASPSHLQPRMQSPRPWWPLASSGFGTMIRRGPKVPGMGRHCYCGPIWVGTQHGNHCPHVVIYKNTTRNSASQLEVSWTLKKTELRKIDAFELWCRRRLLRVSWTARRFPKGNKS